MTFHGGSNSIGLGMWIWDGAIHSIVVIATHQGIVPRRMDRRCLYLVARFVSFHFIRLLTAIFSIYLVYGSILVAFIKMVYCVFILKIIIRHGWNSVAWPLALNHSLLNRVEWSRGPMPQGTASTASRSN